jgi:hypothetical protein
MPVVQLPEQVSAITIAGGNTAPSGRLSTVTSPVSTTDITSPYTRPSLVNANANGTLQIRLPASITAITVNSVVWTITGGVAQNVAAVDGTLFLQQNIILVQG